MEKREPVNILLVDDQPAKLLSYDAILADLGENLVKASSGREALEFLLKGEIAVVLVDVCMPELDGYELTSMIRSHPRFQQTAIILVSGVMLEEVDRIKGYLSGAVDYVSVPIVPEILRAKVTVFADLFRKTKALERLNQELEDRVAQRTAALSETAGRLARAYEASHLLAAIVESSDDAIIGQSLGGTILTWNAGATRLFGYGAAEMLGRNAGPLIPPDRLDEEFRILEKLRRGERVDHFETVRRHLDGALLEVSLTISPIRNEAGDLIGTSQVARDITEQKRTAELMLETQKLESLGVLAGGIAHDFNNLLVGIVGNASLAVDLLPEDSPALRLVRGVLTAGENAAALTRQMLAYSGRGRFVVNRIDLSQYVRETIPLIQAAVPRNVRLRLDLLDGLPAIEADQAQVQQLLMNLVINGAEAVPGGAPGEVSVATRCTIVEPHRKAGAAAAEPAPGTYVMLEVRDNGCGMDDATRARIFEPFFTTKFTGRGLGLAAALGIVRGHSGYIDVSSAPGAGTTFQVLFPAVAQPADELPQEQPGDAAGFAASGAVLVIDDEPVVRTVARNTLERHGYTVLLAEDGERGLELFRRNGDSIRCVVLDLSMPVMGGEETFERLKELRAGIPVILSSGFAEMEVARRFEGKGLAGFIQKPYRASALVEKVRDVTGRDGLRVHAAG